MEVGSCIKIGFKMYILKITCISGKPFLHVNASINNFYPKFESNYVACEMKCELHPSWEDIG